MSIAPPLMCPCPYCETGDDVVAEYVDTDGNGTVNHKRIYWLLKDIDQRIGFVDIHVSTGSKTFYYYLCDQVGSVLRVVDSDGNTVNQYDYDAFGNLIEANSFENVENRYRFQGREWDAHSGSYYFRHRSYIPEQGQSTVNPVRMRDSGTRVKYRYADTAAPAIRRKMLIRGPTFLNRTPPVSATKNLRFPRWS